MGRFNVKLQLKQDRRVSVRRTVPHMTKRVCHTMYSGTTLLIICWHIGHC